MTVAMAVTLAVAMAVTWAVTVVVPVDRHQLALRVHAVTDENPDLLPLVERGHVPLRAVPGQHLVLHLTCRGGRCDPWEREHRRGPDSH